VCEGWCGCRGTGVALGILRTLDETWVRVREDRIVHLDNIQESAEPLQTDEVSGEGEKSEEVVRKTSPLRFIRRFYRALYEEKIFYLDY